MSSTFGIIDIGSNTIRMNIYKIDEMNFRVIMSTKAAAGLVSYVEDHKMSPEGIAKLAEVLDEFKEILSVLHIDEYAVFATASLRNIDNSKEVIEAIHDQCKIPIDLLSGAEEGRMSFAGALHELSRKEGVYIDTGGGSTEVILYKPEGVDFVASMPIGSLNLYNKYVSGIVPTEEEVKKIEHKVKKELKKILPDSEKVHTDFLAVTGGSMRVVRHMLVDLKWIEPTEYILKPAMLEKLLDELLKDEKKSIRRLLKTKADRIHTFMTGLMIILTVAHFFHAQSIQVSTIGLREGYLSEKVLHRGS